MTIRYWLKQLILTAILGVALLGPFYAAAFFTNWSSRPDPVAEGRP